MWKDVEIHVLTQEKPDPDTAIAVQIKTFNTEDRKAHPHIVQNLGDKPATLATSVLMSNATTKEFWNKRIASQQKESIQFK